MTGQNLQSSIEIWRIFYLINFTYLNEENYHVKEKLAAIVVVVVVVVVVFVVIAVVVVVAAALAARLDAM